VPRTRATGAAWNASRLWEDQVRWFRRAAAVVLWPLGVVLAIELLFGRDKSGLLGLPLPYGVPVGILINGAVIGTLYSLVAFGLILVYKANRFINFAQAAIGGVTALLALLLLAGRGWNYYVCVAVMLVGSVLLGAYVEAGILRRYAGQPRLIITVVTIGLLQLFTLIQAFEPRFVTGDALAPVSFPTPFSSLRFDAGGVLLNGDYIAVIVVAGITVVGLTLFLRFTRIGIAIRASAENADRASLLGIPVNRVSTTVWVIAAVLSGVAVFLRGPVVGLPVGGDVAPSTLLYGLAAAVVARMESMPVALAAGMAMGALDQAAVYGTNKPDLSLALVLPVLLAALLLRRNALSRAYDTGVSSFKVLKEHRAIPTELRGLPEVRRARLALALAGVALAVGAPLVVGSANTDFLSLILCYGIVGVSLVVLSGWAGQISLGQFAFAGIGAATAGSLATRHDVDFFVTLVAAGLMGALFAVLIGLPALRVQGLFLAVVTFAFAATVQNVVLNRDYLGAILPEGDARVARPYLWGRVDVTGPVGFYVVCLAGLGLMLLMARGLRRSRSGRVFIGVRDNVRAAQSYGVSAIASRLSAFALSGFIAAFGGALLAYQQGSVDRQAFSPTVSIELFIFVVVGGLAGTATGVAGVLLFESIKYLQPLQHTFGANSWTDFLDVWILPASALIVLNFLPGGLGDGLYRLRDGWLRRLAARHDIVVPSLLADKRVEEAEVAREEVALEVAAGTVSESESDLPPAPEPEVPSFVPSDDALLVCEGIDVAYDGVQVLFGVDLEVRRGEILALLGTNGAGKSTLLKAISGLVPPSAGRVTYAGEDVTKLDAVSMAKLRVVQVPGGKGVFPTLTVAEHFTAAAWLLRKDPDLAVRQEEVLDRFPRLRERFDQLAGNLSGGEQQQLALGMAFLARPDLLIIDELSLGLAPTIVEQLLELVREINADGTAVVLVEQSVNVALSVADRAYFMEKGEVRFEGPTRELLERDDIVRSVFLEGAGTGRPVSAQARAERVAETAMNLRPVVLEATGVSVSFGGIRAVVNVDLELREGEILGLIGPNGAGKTTVFDVLSGFLTPSAGTVRFLGEDVTGWSPDRRARWGLGRSFQDARIFPSLTVAENIALSLERHLEVRDHLAAAIGLPAVRELEVDVAWTVADLIELMHLGAFRDKFVGELSTGSRRVVDLAMSIAHDPTVLVLDEPSSGIAQRETEALGPLLQRIRTETGCAMLVIEHDMPLITTVSDRLLALELGRVIAEGTPEDVIGDPRVVSSYLGTTDGSTVHRSGIPVGSRT
jgi:ABC-type branched-subunit amino acid transport system ATPase component/ABC-type branched-subunit amino acid transport system permease subunit